MFADYHLHTAFSNDSETPMEDMLQRAIALGLDEICFTEHVDYGIKQLDNCDYDAYFRSISIMREKYGGQMTIRAGIEFGVQLETIHSTTKFFNNTRLTLFFSAAIRSAERSSGAVNTRREKHRRSTKRAITITSLPSCSTIQITLSWDIWT